MQQWLIVVAGGIAVYLWLSIVVPPLVTGTIVTARAIVHGGWRGALLVSGGAAAIATVIPAAVLLFATALAPGEALEIVRDPALPAGLQVGSIVWAARAIAFGFPRLPAGCEVGLAMAAASFWDDSPAALARIERRYLKHILRVGSTHAHAPSQTAPSSSRAYGRVAG